MLRAERDQWGLVLMIDVAIPLDVVNVETAFPCSADGAEVVPGREELLPLGSPRTTVACCRRSRVTVDDADVATVAALDRAVVPGRVATRLRREVELVAARPACPHFRWIASLAIGCALLRAEPLLGVGGVPVDGRRARQARNSRSRSRPAPPLGGGALPAVLGRRSAATLVNHESGCAAGWAGDIDSPTRRPLARAAGPREVLGLSYVGDCRVVVARVRRGAEQPGDRDDLDRRRGGGGLSQAEASCWRSGAAWKDARTGWLERAQGITTRASRHVSPRCSALWGASRPVWRASRPWLQLRRARESPRHVATPLMSRDPVDRRAAEGHTRPGRAHRRRPARTSRTYIRPML